MPKTLKRSKAWLDVFVCIFDTSVSLALLSCHLKMTVADNTCQEAANQGQCHGALPWQRLRITGWWTIDLSRVFYLCSFFRSYFSYNLYWFFADFPCLVIDVVFEINPYNLESVMVGDFCLVSKHTNKQIVPLTFKKVWTKSFFKIFKYN